MLKFPARWSNPHQHIIPLHAKYVVIWAIIIFAAASSHIPAFSILYEQSNYRSQASIASPQKVEAVAGKKAPIRKTKSVKIVQEHSEETVKAESADKASVLTNTSEKKRTTPTPIKTQPVVRANLPTITIAPSPTPVIQVESDQAPGDSRQQLLSALNAYRQKKGKSSLSWDNTLASFAQSRAEKFDREGKMDEHAGFRDMLNNNGFQQMGFMALAENSSYGDTRDPVYIVETMYGQSPGHDANQLNGEYTYVGIGALGKATDFVFGGRKK